MAQKTDKLKKVVRGKNGGYRPGSGRKPREKALTNYQTALRLMDDNIGQALAVLIGGLKDKDKNYRLKCAEILMKKALPDKSRHEVQANMQVEYVIDIIDDDGEGEADS